MPRSPQLDPKTPPAQPATPRRSTIRRASKIILATAIIATVCTITAPKTSAQDLGEIARQERAKKQNNPAPAATHIYTNEDLQRHQILVPEDQSRFSATTQPAIVAPSKSTIQLASELTPPGNADRLIGARPPLLPISNAPDTTSPPTRTSIHQSAQQQTKQLPAQPNISPASTTRTEISVASATSGKSVPAPPSQPASKIIPVALAQIPVAQIVAQFTDVPIATTVPLDQMPLGDVARYYRLVKHVSARANPQTIPGRVNAPSAPALATIIPNAIPLDQMPLGDVARYYRAKARSTAPTTAYPLTLAAMPLASMKRPPTRPSRIVPIKRPSITRAPGASLPLTQRHPVSIHITSGNTLWQLARHYLGAGTRWQELLALNPTIQNPKRLQVGTQLALPQ